MSNTEIVVVLTTLPDARSAQSVAETLLSRGLAACVSAFPVTSRYEWQERLECAEETQLMIKSTAACYEAIEACLREIHPYELPEILAIPVVCGLPGYLGWVASRVASGAHGPTEKGGAGAKKG